MDREHARADLEAAERAIAALGREIAAVAPVAPIAGKGPGRFHRRLADEAQ